MKIPYFLIHLTVYLTTEFSEGQKYNCEKPKLKNGTVRIRSRGQVVRFRCNRPLWLAGTKLALCIKDVWNLPVPLCVAPGIKCPKQKFSKDLLVNESLNHGFLVFSCKPGLILEGNDKIYCDGSQWSDETPKCVYHVSTEATTDPLATAAVSTETGHSSNQSAPTTETYSTDNNRQETKPTEQPSTKAKPTEQSTTSATVKSSERSKTTENITTLTTAEPSREAKTEPKGTTTFPPSSTQKPQKPTSASSPTTTEVKTTTAAPAKTSSISSIQSTTVTRSMDSATSKLTDQQKRRKCENDISDLQKQVLQADLCRIKEETELSKLQKEKVSLEIKKLKYEVSLYGVQS
ncbi:LOW QUALITY PROTEIN: complement decay-accelerating factor, GPI-anchored-like [Crassostrea angulata]|uniref:LOW QUALITY PROTEIN: complement decay-accelerating factor, GPI-anchored-like n=1 Tax=Magallana angulata TaxID=2784310 RepID=UPI0022B20B37|nr:LOW QUALITY PROTEIN: complement decay-accelerating factor, GPI-anchored-like [Crassostrea angulata]